MDSLILVSHGGVTDAAYCRQVAGFGFCLLLPNDVADSHDPTGDNDLAPTDDVDRLAAVAEQEEMDVRRTSSRCVRYCAPELTRELFFGGAACKASGTIDAKWDERVDLYSFALIVWELFAGQPPLAQHSDPGSAAAAASKGERPPLAMLHRSEALAALLQRAWAADPKDRCTAEDAVNVLHGLSANVSNGHGSCCGSVCIVA